MGFACHQRPRNIEQIERELRGETPAPTIDPDWIRLTEACRIMCTSYSSLHYLNYSRSLATKSAGMAGRNGGVLVRRSEVEAVITIRRIARLSMRDAFRVFAARAKIAPLLSGDSGA